VVIPVLGIEQRVVDVVVGLRLGHGPVDVRAEVARALTLHGLVEVVPVVVAARVAVEVEADRDVGPPAVLRVVDVLVDRRRVRRRQLG
jgi:hypothetical protein